MCFCFFCTVNVCYLLCIVWFSGALCTVQAFSEHVFLDNGMYAVSTSIISWLLVHILAATCEYAIRQQMIVYECLYEIVLTN